MRNSRKRATAIAQCEVVLTGIKYTELYLVYDEKKRLNFELHSHQMQIQIILLTAGFTDSVRG